MKLLEHAVKVKEHVSQNNQGKGGKNWHAVCIQAWKRNYQCNICCKTGATEITRMWANAQRDGRPAEHRWRPLFNAAKFG